MKWVKRIKLMQVSKIAIVICVILSTVLAGFTIYGEKVGSFVIDTQADNPQINIALSEFEDLSQQTDRLAVKGLSDQRDTTYADIPFFKILNRTGSSTDTDFRRYIAHSFYVVNNSEIAVDLLISMNITAIQKDVDSAVRVCVIYGEELGGTVYAKWQEELGEGGWTEKLINGERVPETDPDAGETVMFYDESVVMQDTVTEFEAGGALKITIVVWLEGYDLQCIDELYGGSIRMIMNIKAY